MQAVIGQRLLSSLKPADKPYEVRDTQLKGFILRVQPSGILSYLVQYARAKRITIGPASIHTPTRARTLAKDVLAAAHQGATAAELKQIIRGAEVGLTLERYLDEKYGPWVKTSRKDGAATLTRIMACFREDLGARLIEEITPWLIEKWRLARFRAGTKPATVNRDLAALKAALSSAVEWGLLKMHPLATVKPSKVDTHGVVRYLAADEEQRLRTALDAREAGMRKGRESGNAWRKERGYALMPELDGVFADYLKPMVLVSINTGLRRGELFGLSWADVSLERRILTVRSSTAKAGKTRHVPLNAEAWQVLKDWKAQQPDTGGLVFPGKGGAPMDNVRKSWDGVLDEAKISNFRWHDLRHHFASKLVMAGVDLNTVRELLGHADIKMTLRYAHLAPEHKAAAVARLIEVNHADSQEAVSAPVGAGREI